MTYTFETIVKEVKRVLFGHLDGLDHTKWRLKDVSVEDDVIYVTVTNGRKEIVGSGSGSLEAARNAKELVREYQGK